MINKYGLIGYPLSHSFSPGYFRDKFARESITADYQSYPLESLDGMMPLFDEGMLGLNVTIPYKEKVMPLLDEIEQEAAEVGAVNTIKKIGTRLVGYNTDIYGFRESIIVLKLPFSFEGSLALILGTGGASKAIHFVLTSLGMTCHFASRTSASNNEVFSYDQLKEVHLSRYKIIVNTTPLGMYPSISEIADISIWDLGPGQLVYDLIYNPERTLLLREAASLGCMIKNGLEMLELQAEKSWEIWNS